GARRTCKELAVIRVDAENRAGREPHDRVASREMPGLHRARLGYCSHSGGEDFTLLFRVFPAPKVGAEGGRDHDLEHAKAGRGRTTVLADAGLGLLLAYCRFMAA